jgi:hypothetical protein
VYWSHGHHAVSATGRYISRARGIDTFLSSCRGLVLRRLQVLCQSKQREDPRSSTCTDGNFRATEDNADFGKHGTCDHSLRRPGRQARVAPTPWRSEHRHWMVRDSLKRDLQARVRSGEELRFVMGGCVVCSFSRLGGCRMAYRWT